MEFPTSVAPFDEPYPADRFGDVHVIITNRNHPQILGSATTGVSRGKQGFLLTAFNCLPPDQNNDGDAPLSGVAFSWLAVLLTDQPRDDRCEVRFGLIPWRDYTAYSHHRYSDTHSLYADEPFSDDSGEKFVFLTTTESNVVNGAASSADQRGIVDLSGFQISRHDGGGRLYWMVICKNENGESTKPNTRDSYFDADELWLHVARTSPTKFIPTGYPSAWRRDWVRFPQPFQERRPCTFVTSNRHGVDGHHANVMAMVWNGTSTDYPIAGLTVDPVRGESSFDAVTIGHVTAETHIKSPSQGPPTAWEYMQGVDDEESWYELASTGKIGVNEFGPHGGSLLLHCIYERHERINTALARRLFALGADPNQHHPVTHLTPLHLAAFLNRESMAYLLIERGADLNAATVPGTTSPFPTPWDLSRIRHDPLRKHQGETTLHLAMWQRNFDIALALLKAGAAPNAEDCRGNRPIDYVPNWFASPDFQTHWQLINHRRLATIEDYEAIIDAFR